MKQGRFPFGSEGPRNLVNTARWTRDGNTTRMTWFASRTLLGLFSVLVMGTGPMTRITPPPDSLPTHVVRESRWKINTHLFAANQALADALNDGMVTIPPYGEFPVAAAALRALKAAPASYRAGVLAPDLFPDMYVGGWFIHSDLSREADGWIADDWMRHVWTRAWGWQEPSERDKVLAFAYGFLTHGAGDMFAHTWVNEKADGAWITFTGPARSTAVKHVVLEGYVGAHTPPTDLSLDVWPRLVSNVLIRDPIARQHSRSAAHYRTWREIYDCLGPLIDRAKREMNNNIRDDAPYWAKCLANPVPCAKKEQMETWRLDINRGLRALVDSSQTLGERLMEHEAGEGVDAMTGWMKEWIPKMFGAHAIGEGMAALQDFLNWVGDPFAPITEPIMDEVQRFFKNQFPQYYELYQAVQDPAYQMDQAGFPAGTRAQVDQEMRLASGGSGPFDWHAFAPIYNSVILSKLALLDGDGLNELVRRAGLSGTPFAPGERTNVMLGVFQSMTQSFQWTGDTITAETKFGICGHEGGISLPPREQCGIRQRDYATAGRSSQRTREAGFVLWGYPGAREKIFGVIFKGFGPGPGSSTLNVATEVMRVIPGMRETARALRVSSDQADHMREIIDVMQGKVAGAVTAAAPAATTPATRIGVRQPARPPAAPAASAETITDWGQRCCSRDISELRTALAVIQTASRNLQSPTTLSQLGRKPSVTQLGTLVGEINAALDAFTNTRDAAAATAALKNVAGLVGTLAGLITGTQ